MDWSAAFEDALPYDRFLDRFATPEQRSRWTSIHDRVRLTGDQKALVAGFKRPMHALCLAGAWCGDCVNQCPIFDHIAAASTVIDLRFLDRDAREDARSALSINGGARVPVLVLLSEDFEEVLRYGDRTISTYRKLAADQLGPSCPTGLVPPADDLIAAVTADWLVEFERAQLLLRLSPKLRKKYDD